eukprot:6852738-Prymnesium_polylepis.2
MLAPCLDSHSMTTAHKVSVSVGVAMHVRGRSECSVDVEVEKIQRVGVQARTKRGPGADEGPAHRPPRPRVTDPSTRPVCCDAPTRCVSRVPPRRRPGAAARALGRSRVVARGPLAPPRP